MSFSLNSLLSLRLKCPTWPGRGDLPSGNPGDSVTGMAMSSMREVALQGGASGGEGGTIASVHHDHHIGSSYHYGARILLHVPFLKVHE